MCYVLGWIDPLGHICISSFGYFAVQRLGGYIMQVDRWMVDGLMIATSTSWGQALHVLYKYKAACIDTNRYSAPFSLVLVLSQDE